MSAKGKPLPKLMLGALGVVFGDIGTSPLYAVKQVFQDQPSFGHDPAAVTGIMALIVWSVILAVCLKYTLFIMRADHDGEGGTLAMLGLIEKDHPSIAGTRPGALVLLVLFASALLYGDGMITPAISVLSAVEGLNVSTDIFKPYIVPIASGILLALFLLQNRGTERVGKLFGPVMLLWFGVIGGLGLASLIVHPVALTCLNPAAALAFLFTHGWKGYLTLGAVVLAFSGVEALFADMGHFGRKPIILSWYGIVLPGLMLNYLGQGALLLQDPKAAAAPFFALVPHWGMFPMVLLSTAATIIASQALISGAFSVTRQAVIMGLAPRFAIKHTSAENRGQVYMPVVNGFLMIGCLAMVLGFRSSDALGNAYGLAVIGTMTITSIVFFIVMRRVWHWPLGYALPLLLAFLTFDLAFLGANIVKIPEGAWVPLVIALVVFTLLAVWTDGRARYFQALGRWSMPAAEFCRDMKSWEKRRAGSVVFLTFDLDRVPLVGCHHWLLANCRYDNVLLLRIRTTSAPYVAEADRVEVRALGNGLFSAEARFGFMELPNVGDVLPKALPFAWDDVVFMLPQPIACEASRFWSRLEQHLFLFLGRLGLSLVEWLHIPPNQSLGVGLELEF